MLAQCKTALKTPVGISEAFLSGFAMNLKNSSIFRFKCVKKLWLCKKKINLPDKAKSEILKHISGSP